MRKPVCWTDKKHEGGRREVRVTFHGDSVKWQFRVAGAEEWDYTTPPTEEDWKQLEERIQNLHQRGHLLEHERELVKKRVYTPDTPRKRKKEPRPRDPNLIWKD